ncbi:alpha/beta hydrolase [Seonamhaeicola sp.]|uniref:alpha/beta hydrolase n=1 Tax=Seonamhaeicola sp. TaxID=1912245 RepID=UPI0026345CFB|nr:alpha/beta hydrolase [Seonamhaeicola sp.]
MKYKLVLLLFLLNCLVWSQNKTTYTYAIKGTDTLKMDVYTPKNVRSIDSLPVILWMHGGGFAGGKRDNPDEVKMMQYLTESGYVGVSISYRLLLKGSKTGVGCDCPKTFKLDVFRQAALDYLDAARYLVENRSKLHVDPTKIIAGGSSAGAEGALSAVYLKHFYVDDTSQYEAVNFAGIMALAGAMVDADYISENNAVPTVLFHGTDDDLVPFGKAPHHYCTPDRPGYLILDGSEIIANKLQDLEASYYFNKVVGGRHELSQIPFEKLDDILDFFKRTIHGNETIQTTIIVNKN